MSTMDMGRDQKGLACIGQYLGIHSNYSGATGASIAASAIEAARQDCSPLWLCLAIDQSGVAPGLT